MLEKLSDKYTAFFDRADVRRALFWLILAVGVFVRAFRLGAVPNGINQDEAFAAYEAWSLLNYGIDTAGYHNPVYLIAWGSGMNALETYLMMPFIALFGLETWAIRMPQMIVASLSIPAMYELVKRTVSERAGLLAMLMLAICPWHIIMSRWALESNLAPGLLLFGLYFFVRGTENARFLPLSALMYGLALYTYATIWPFVPVMLAVQVFYCARHGKLKLTRHAVFAVLILFLLALPLLLFLAVNYGLIDEIVTPLFSVPKLYYMRTGELSFDEKARKLEIFTNIFIKQNDGYIYSSPDKFGLFYYASLPFALLGIIYLAKTLSRARKAHEYCPALLLIVQLLVCLPLLILIKGNATKFNVFFIPLVVLIALGVYDVSLISPRAVAGVVAVLYVLVFIGFERYYFTEYEIKTREHFSYGLEDALDFAEDKGERVYLDQNEFYTKVLFYTQTPVTTFRDTVQYLYFPAMYLHALSFDNYYFWLDPYAPDPGGVYIIPSDSDFGVLSERGYTFRDIGGYTVAYLEG